MKQPWKDRRRHLPGFVVALVAVLAADRLSAAEPRWRPVGPPATPQTARLVFDPTNGARGFALSEAGLWRSQSGGGDWRSIQVGLDGPPQAFAVDPKRPGRVYAAVNAFDVASQIRALLPTERGFVAAQEQPSTSPEPPEIPLSMSEDGGRTWNNAPLINPIALAADPNDPRHLIASAFRYEGATVPQNGVYAIEVP